MLKKLGSCLIIICTLLALCSCSETETTQESIKYDTLDSLKGKTAAVFVGSIFDELLSEYIGDIDLSYYQSATECFGALLEGKVDCTINEQGQAYLAVKENPELSLLPYEIGNYEYGAIFAHDEKGFVKKTEFNDYLKECYSNESLQSLYEEWLTLSDGKDIDYESLPNINGSITLATDGLGYPLTYIRNGKFTGFEIELIYNYCKYKGYSLNIDQYDFSGILASVTSGKADIGVGCIIITEERQKSYYFSEGYAKGNASIVIRKENSVSKYNSILELSGKKFGVLAGTINDLYVQNAVDNPELEYYNTMTDIIKAIISEKVDAGTASNLVFDSKLAENNGVISIGSIVNEQLGFILAKNEKCDLIKYDLDEYLIKIKNNGQLQEIIDKWLSGQESEKDVDYSGLEDINGTIQLAVCSDNGAPSCYYKEDKIVGLDIDIFVHFAQEYGYDVEINDYSFSGMLTAVSTGICDVGGSNITITEERKKSMSFSEPFYDGQILVLVKKQTNETKSDNFLTNIASSFQRTLIDENRYKLYIDGTIATTIITICSTIFGTLLGYAIYMLFRKNHTITNNLLKLYEWFVSGLPAVVILMVFYYIIFGNSKLSGLWISIIAFTIIFSVTIFGLLKTSFMSVDKGQYEAAYSLGYNKKETIRHIIIPQILPIFLPPFKAEVISLVKATSIVGYIAVQDITKISDIIRSRTYEAFFPLIITTIIYFLLVTLFTILISKLEKRFNPKNRSIESILKGTK